MDYYKIGQRIRKYRKACNLSQEELAEKVEISIPHLSHIETGNTKLSLPVLVNIAEVLNVKTDDLLYDTPNNTVKLKGEIIDILDSCTSKDLAVISDIIKATKISLEKYIN